MDDRNAAVFDPITERWPPVYDAAELAAPLTHLVQSGTLHSEFYQSPRTGPPICQGDIVRLPNKEALAGIASVEARMSVVGWVLLHSCLVRFLSCDDGRFD